MFDMNGSKYTFASLSYDILFAGATANMNVQEHKFDERFDCPQYETWNHALPTCDYLYTECMKPPLLKKQKMSYNSSYEGKFLNL